MIPSRASISRTRCPFPRPPIAGLQDITPIPARSSVTRAVRDPIRAAACAASDPAWPPPITMTSKVLFHVKHSITSRRRSSRISRQARSRYRRVLPENQAPDSRRSSSAARSAALFTRFYQWPRRLQRFEPRRIASACRTRVAIPVSRLRAPSLCETRSISSGIPAPVRPGYRPADSPRRSPLLRSTISSSATGISGGSPSTRKTRRSAARPAPRAGPCRCSRPHRHSASTPRYPARDRQPVEIHPHLDHIPRRPGMLGRDGGLAPRQRVEKVDFPTFGAPTIATSNPDRIRSAAHAPDLAFEPAITSHPRG